MNELGEGMRITSQVFNGKTILEDLKDLVSRFLKGERSDLDVKFNPYLKVTQNEFCELLDDFDYGGYEPTNTLINGDLIYEGTYMYVDDDKVASNRHILTSKIIHVFFHKEKKEKGTTLYAIHWIEGFTWGAGIKIEHYDE
jgi:hypothetical protein